MAMCLNRLLRCRFFHRQSWIWLRKKLATSQEHIHIWAVYSEDSHQARNRPIRHFNHLDCEVGQYTLIWEISLPWWTTSITKACTLRQLARGKWKYPIYTSRLDDQRYSLLCQQSGVRRKSPADVIILLIPCAWNCSYLSLTLKEPYEQSGRFTGIC